MKTKLTVQMSHNENIIWRWTEEISEKAMFRLGVDEYRAVVKAAEKELANQIKLSKRGGRDEADKMGA